MDQRQTLPLIWLVSDARNDAVMEAALRALPPGSGFVFRHYHLDAEARRARFEGLARGAGRGHVMVLAGAVEEASDWGAQGVYGAPDTITGAPGGLLRLASAHDGSQLRAAQAAGANGVFLSPVFATRSHPGASTLGIHGFHVLAQQSAIPVIALGGMTPARARTLGWPRWAAIDGLGPPQSS